MKIWVVIAISCTACGSRSVATFDHKPTDGEVEKVVSECGGMYCINEYITQTEVNGDPVDMEDDL